MATSTRAATPWHDFPLRETPIRTLLATGYYLIERDPLPVCSGELAGGRREAAGWVCWEDLEK